METTDRIREFVRKNLAVFEEGVSFKDSDNIFSLGLVDSYFAIQLISFIEEQFGFTVSEQDLDIANFNSVNRIAAFVGSREGNADAKQSR
jgi:acyl carrier protein